MLSQDDGLVAAVYSPCEVKTQVRGTEVRISEETEYPFRGVVRMRIEPSSAVAFPLRLRVPVWAEGPAISVNSTPVDVSAKNGFAKIERTWKPGDVVELRLPMTPRVIKGYNDSVSIERGPLVFSLPIGESWVKLCDRGMTADWQVFPTSQWNYALSGSVRGSGAIEAREHQVGDSPFSLKEAPMNLLVRARQMPTWRAVDGAADPVPPSPAASSEKEETITLVPYGTAKLRITSFPELRS
jgi:hypothetical protein